MEPQELAENTEKARETGQRAIGLTMAILAVLLAVSTLLGHRAHTEEVLLETRATDQWNYFQAKNIRSHVYDADAEIANLFADKGAQAAADFRVKSAQQKKDSEEIQAEAEKLGSCHRTQLDFAAGQKQGLLASFVSVRRGWNRNRPLGTSPLRETRVW
jgi:hypothetical protein